MSTLKCVSLSTGRFKVISIGFIQWSVNYSNRLVHAHNTCWGRVFEETFNKCKVSRLWRTTKRNFLPSFKFFRVDFVNFRCNIVGNALDNKNSIVYIEENSGHLQSSLLVLVQDGRWIFKKSLNEWILGWSRSTNVGWYLFVVGWFSKNPELFGNFFEDDAHNYVVLIVNVEESECLLGREILVSSNKVARYIEIGGKKFAQMIIIRWFRRAFSTPVLPCFSFSIEYITCWIGRQFNLFDCF